MEILISVLTASKFETPIDVTGLSFQTFMKRFRKIMDSSQNAANEDTSLLTNKLEHIERQVFTAGRKGVKEFLQWEAGRTSKLTTSENVVNHKKRKRSMIE